MELFKRLSQLLESSAFRLAAGAVGAFVVLATAIVGIVFWQTNAVLTDQVVATLSAEAEALQTEARGGVTGLVDSIAARSRSEGPALYVLVDGAGRKLAGNLSRVPPEVSPRQIGGVFHYRPGSAGQVSTPKPERLAVARVIALPGGEVLVVGRDIEDQLRYADGVKRVVIGSFVALLALGLTIAFLISRLVLKRIEAINIAARQIMAGDFTRRVPVDGSGDELDGLAVNLNAMLERIEQLMAGLKEVSDNIAHDLKTPLNRLRNRVEGALREEGPEGHREALERTIEEADDLIRTFNALLLIARLEASAVDDSATSVDVGRLVAGVGEFYAPVAEEAGQRLEVVAGDGPIIIANGQLLGQAIANLVDNAIKYSAAEIAGGVGAIGRTDDDRGLIRVSVEASDDGVSILVADQGPGIAAGDRERALRRFVRLDASRTRPGTGLGLSLVAAVARLHGGHVVLEDNKPGLRVRLALPRRLPLAAQSDGFQGADTAPAGDATGAAPLNSTLEQRVPTP